MNDHQIRQAIITGIKELISQGGSVPLDDYDDAMPITDTGLDSLEFAMLVAKLEDDLGFDPFVALSDAIYPTTVGEFTAVYVNYTR